MTTPAPAPSVTTRPRPPVGRALCPTSPCLSASDITRRPPPLPLGHQSFSFPSPSPVGRALCPTSPCLSASDIARRRPTLPLRQTRPQINLPRQPPLLEPPCVSPSLPSFPAAKPYLSRRPIQPIHRVSPSYPPAKPRCVSPPTTTFQCVVGRRSPFMSIGSSIAQSRHPFHHPCGAHCSSAPSPRYCAPCG